jgi:hypothetical protein
MFGSLPMMPVQQQYVPQPQYVQGQPSWPPQQYAPQPQYVQGQQGWAPQGQYQQPSGQYQAPPQRPPQPKAQPQPQPNWVPPPAQTAQAPAARQLQAAPPLVVRGKIDDPPELPARAIAPIQLPPAPVVLPSPEALNVTPKSAVAPAPPVDWNAAMVRFNRVGGMGIQRAQMPDGRYRVALTLRTDVADQTHNIEATAATEAEAVSAALTGAEEWASRR